MLDSAFAAHAHVPLADWLGTDVAPQPGRTSLAGKLACYNVYETADGKSMALGALEPQFWEDFCMAVERRIGWPGTALRTSPACALRWQGCFAHSLGHIGSTCLPPAIVAASRYWL